jgi:outer membrane protein assembly factor BamB
MTEPANERPEKMRLSLPNGEHIVLVDMLTKAGSTSEVNRNVYRLNREGEVLWRIQSDASGEDRQPYTNISFDESGTLKAYCWNGAEYSVDLETGTIDQGILVR